MVDMPPRQTGALIPLDDDGLTVGKVPVAGVGLRVGLMFSGQLTLMFSGQLTLMFSGQLTLMSPAKARRLSHDFETASAKEAGLDWVAVALRESADEIEALSATKQ